MIRVILKPNREKPVRASHPWIFSGAIDQVDADFKKGDLVQVLTHKEEFLGIGYINPDSQISTRMLTFQDEAINKSFFKKRFEEARTLRAQFISKDTNAYRLIHSESDFLPGLILDQYDDFIAAQFLTAGMEQLKSVILQVIQEVFHPKGIFDKSDAGARNQEGLKMTHGVLSGEEPPDQINIEEYGVRFKVDLKQSQKTGFFLDQRENRHWVGQHSTGKRVLDCFAYSGGFSVHAAKGGAASVTAVEEQKHACEMIRKNFGIHGFISDSYKVECCDVFNFLRQDQNSYDLIVLDPPAFCKHKKQVAKAAKGYKDINLNAMKRVAPGGLLLTFSCSSFVDADLFQKIIFGAAKDAKRNVQIIQKTANAFDHPANIYHPEGEYLKGLILRVL
jgi:23S rRNA (cytosine1962-C5)-methyltransferase